MPCSNAIVGIYLKAWLFCWTEVGAEVAGIVQSLITTCRLQVVDPYTYLADVLQSVQIHAAKRREELTPRTRKACFSQNPLYSHIERFSPKTASSSVTSTAAQPLPAAPSFG